MDQILGKIKKIMVIERKKTSEASLLLMKYYSIFCYIRIFSIFVLFFDVFTWAQLAIFWVVLLINSGLCIAVSISNLLQEKSLKKFQCKKKSFFNIF